MPFDYNATASAMKCGGSTPQGVSTVGGFDSRNRPSGAWVQAKARWVYPEEPPHFIALDAGYQGKEETWQSRRMPAMWT